MTKDDISSWFHLTLLIPHDTNLYEYKHTLVLITDDEDPGTHYFKILQVQLKDVFPYVPLFFHTNQKLSGSLA